MLLRIGFVCEVLHDSLACGFTTAFERRKDGWSAPHAPRLVGDFLRLVRQGTLGKAVEHVAFEIAVGDDPVGDTLQQQIPDAAVTAAET